MKSNLKKVKCEFNVLDKEEGKKFTFNIGPNEKITIYDEELIEKIIENKFNKKYRKLLYIAMDISESDDSTESDVDIALIKIEDLKNKLLSKYYKFISKELLNKYLKMLMLLEEKLNIPKRGRGR